MPYKRIAGSKREVAILLVTSRDTGRWVLPKGNLIFGTPPHRAAAIEAEEEAGVRGSIAKKPLGQYPYRKWLGPQRFEIAEVDVFALKVRKTLSKYKERDQRERRWVGREEAAEMIDEPELRELIRAAVLD